MNDPSRVISRWFVCKADADQLRVVRNSIVLFTADRRAYHGAWRAQDITDCLTGADPGTVQIVGIDEDELTRAGCPHGQVIDFLSGSGVFAALLIELFAQYRRARTAR